MNGISTNRRTTEHVACLHSAGIQFVARYYSTTTHQPEKVLTRSEAQAISAAGMTIVTVYEDLPTKVDYFSTSRGQRDGVNAYHTAVDLGQPRGSGIYFAGDYDASQSDIANAISDYFRGVRQGFADAAQGVTPLYSIGVYGSGACCDWIKAHLRIANYSWLAESTGWLGSRTYTDWNIKQSIAATGLCGFTAGIGGSFEDNIGQNEIGGFGVVVPATVVDAVNAAVAVSSRTAAAAPGAAASGLSGPVGPDGWKMHFKMQLRASSQIVEGRLSLVNGAGDEVLNIQATSGTRNHQAPSDTWLKGLGPIPPNPDPSVGNCVETLERSTPIISREFRIRPEEVTQPDPPHVTRSAFRVHQDGGAPGSAGCIAISSPQDFDRFAEIMHDLNKYPVETIPLTIEYV
jgi:hypothetical protein